MARKVRIEFPGAVYHLLDRGDRREAIFRDDEDRERFLKPLWRIGDANRERLHAWVLMSNHYHLMLERVVNGWPEATLELGHGSRVSQALRRRETLKLADKLERALLQ